MSFGEFLKIAQQNQVYNDARAKKIAEEQKKRQEQCLKERRAIEEANRCIKPPPPPKKSDVHLEYDPTAVSAKSAVGSNPLHKSARVEEYVPTPIPKKKLSSLMDALAEMNGQSSVPPIRRPAGIKIPKINRDSSGLQSSKKVNQGIISDSQTSNSASSYNVPKDNLQSTQKSSKSSIHLQTKPLQRARGSNDSGNARPSITNGRLNGQVPPQLNGKVRSLGSTSRDRLPPQSRPLNAKPSTSNHQSIPPRSISSHFPSSSSTRATVKPSLSKRPEVKSRLDIKSSSSLKPGSLNWPSSTALSSEKPQQTRKQSVPQPVNKAPKPPTGIAAQFGLLNPRLSGRDVRLPKVPTKPPQASGIAAQLGLPGPVPRPSLSKSVPPKPASVATGIAVKFGFHTRQEVKPSSSAHPTATTSKPLQKVLPPGSGELKRKALVTTTRPAVAPPPKQPRMVPVSLRQPQAPARGIAAQFGIAPLAASGFAPAAVSDDEEDEYESDDSFIDDSDCTSVKEFEKVVQEVHKTLGYDPKKYAKVSKFDDLSTMESSYRQIEKEEKLSLRLAAREDEADMAEEAERRRRRLAKRMR